MVARRVRGTILLAALLALPAGTATAGDPALAEQLFEDGLDPRFERFLHDLVA